MALGATVEELEARLTWSLGETLLEDCLVRLREPREGVSVPGTVELEERLAGPRLGRSEAEDEG